MQARFSHKLTLSEEKDLIRRAKDGDWRADMELDERLYARGNASEFSGEMIRLYVEHLEERCEDWDSIASITLGSIYGDEKWGMMDTAKSMSKYCLAWKQGMLYGRECLGFEYYTGQLVEQDFQRAFELLSTSEEDPESWQTKYILGEMYLKGLHVQQDYKKAMEYFLAVVSDKTDAKALDAFFYKAHDRLSEMYRQGLGVERSVERAEHYLDKKERYHRQRPLIALRYLNQSRHIS